MAANDECYTPAEWLQRAREVMGRIDTDPTSCEAANEVVCARRFYTVERDGLAKRVRWRGNVWFQPPYSKPLPFVIKLLDEFNAGHCTQAIALLNARPGSAWFQMLARVGWRCEKRGRIRFYGPGVGHGNGSGFQDNVFFYLGLQPLRFAAVFQDVGEIVRPTVTLSVTDEGGERLPFVAGCEVCGRSLAGHRSNATTCGPRCRQRRHRARLTRQ